MKKIVLGLISISALGFFGCADFWDALLEGGSGSSYSAYDTVTATESKSYTYDSSYPIFEVAPTTKSVNISNVPSGKNIYIAKVNTGSSTVAAKDTRSVTSTASASGYRAASESEFKSFDETQIPQSQFKHFHAPEISLKDVQNAARATTTGTGLFTKTQISRTVGATKPIYVDNSVDMKSYAAKPATLRAVGTYCNVWVVDDYYTSGTASGAKVNSSIAKKFAEKFDSFYLVVRNIFGEECDNIIYTYSNASTLEAASRNYPMTSYSDTGTIVNIVLYDIGVDSNLPQNQQCGVLGYFYSKDYYSQTDLTTSVIKYSNQGKYFYVDSAYSVSNFDTVISTLAHEFQHMVNFGVKNVEQGVDSPRDTEFNIENKVDTAYNEMLSMLCEDMMSDFLELTDANNVKAERLPYFNTYYFLSGIREYLSTNSALSYSTSYAFGSWLCRQYGGAALVKKIMSSSYGGNESFVKAVNSLNNKNFTFDELFQQFLLACTNGGSTSGYTHNQYADRTVQYPPTGTVEYDYPMTAINLWTSAYSYPNNEVPLLDGQKDVAFDTSASTYTGPFLWSNNYRYTLRPGYGITLHKLGTTTSSELSLTFSSSGADCVTMYVIIQ